jgi:hypothetical protein
MFKKDLTQKEIVEVLMELMFFLIALLLFSYLGFYFCAEIIRSESIFGKISLVVFALFIMFICIVSLLLLFNKCYDSIKQILAVRKANTFRNLKIASLSIFLLIWFTCAQGIFNRIVLGPRDNQAMAQLLYKKSSKTEKHRIGAICSDGTNSSATGRGACSWHGGVEEWLYETEMYHSKSFEECKDEAEQMSLLDYYVFW